MVVVLCNCPPDRAVDIARHVVEAGLAACVNVVPGVNSVYSWKGAVEQEVETALWIKTADAQVEALKAAILAIHPYELPEFVVLPVDARSHAPYVAWVERNGR